MADAHANFAYSTVATAPSPATSGTSLVVAAGEGARFPTAPFNATIWPTGVIPLSTNAEIVRVTARATDTLTITRAQEGSSARTVVAGDQIAATWTVKALTDVETDVATRALDSAVVHLAGAETISGQKTLSSPLLLPDGSTTAPAAAFSADTNTGLRRSAADEMRVVTAGADRVIYDASGNVLLSTAAAAFVANALTDGTGYTQSPLKLRLATDNVAANRVELYPRGLWFGPGGASATGTDVGVERETTAQNALLLWGGGLTTARMRIYNDVTVYNALGAQRSIGQDALASRTTATAAIANTETVVLSATLAANLLQAGTTLRFRASGVGTATGATAGSTWRVRVGPTTLTGTIPASLTGTSAAGTNIPFMVEAVVTVRTAGAAGTIIGGFVYNANAATGNLNTTIAVAQVTTAVAVDTTVANLFELTYISGVSTTTSTFHNAVLELVKA